MTSRAKSESMKRLWANPEWAARTNAAREEAMSRTIRPVGRPFGGGVTVSRRKRIMVSFEPDTAAVLARLADRQGRTVSELVRTYTEWGLEEDGADDTETGR